MNKFTKILSTGIIIFLIITILATVFATETAPETSGNTSPNKTVENNTPEETTKPKENKTEGSTSTNTSSNKENKTDTNTQPKENKSDNNYLSSLTISSGTLTPSFNKNTTSYAVTLADNVTSLTVNATPEDSKAKVSVSGNNNLKKGRNTISVVVTAENGESRTYTIAAIKNSEDEKVDDTIVPSSYVGLGLKSLTIEGIKLKPEFNMKTYTYTATVEHNEDVKLDNIVAVASQDSAKVEIFADKELKEGENVVTVMVTSKSGEDIRVYQVFITKLGENAPPPVEEDKGNSMKKWLIIEICAAGVILLIAIISSIAKKKKNKTKNAKKQTNKKKTLKDDEIEIEVEVKANKKSKKKGGNH